MIRNFFKGKDEDIKIQNGGYESTCPKEKIKKKKKIATYQQTLEMEKDCISKITNVSTDFSSIGTQQKKNKAVQNSTAPGLNPKQRILPLTKNISQNMPPLLLANHYIVL